MCKTLNVTSSHGGKFECINAYLSWTYHSLGRQPKGRINIYWQMRTGAIELDRYQS